VAGTAPKLIPTGAAVLAFAALGLVVSHGLPQRFPPDVAAVASYYSFREQKPFREGRCFITSKDSLSDFDRATCLKIVPDKPNVLLIGDSHAAHLWTALRDTWPGANVLQATASGCKPVIGTTGASRCTAMMAEMFQHFIPRHHLDAVVIGGLWVAEDIAPLKATIEAIRPEVGKVIVFGPMPRYDAPVATLVAKAMLRDDFDSVRSHLLPEPKPLDRLMRREISPLATYVSPFTTLCGTGSCRLFAAPDVPMQFDYNHLTPLGAAVLMHEVKAKHPDLLERANQVPSNPR
jgi:hypothetical protein